MLYQENFTSLNLSQHYSTSQLKDYAYDATVTRAQETCACGLSSASSLFNFKR